MRHFHPYHYSRFPVPLEPRHIALAVFYACLELSRNFQRVAP